MPVILHTGRPPAKSSDAPVPSDTRFADTCKADFRILEVRALSAQTNTLGLPPRRPPACRRLKSFRICGVPMIISRRRPKPRLACRRATSLRLAIVAGNQDRHHPPSRVLVSANVAQNANRFGPIALVDDELKHMPRTVTL